VISIRKLAAVDLAFLGPGFVLAEFALGVVGSAARLLTFASHRRDCIRTSSR